MKRRSPEGAVALVVLFELACGADHADPVESSTIVTSHRDIVGTREALSDDELREVRQHEVDEYNAERSAGWDIVDTRVSPSGQVIDYVVAETLYPEDPSAPFAAPPPAPPSSPEFPESDGVPSIRRGGTEVEVEPSLRPPPGTIPVLREQFAAYIEDPEGSQSLNEFMANFIEPANVSSSGHLYAQHTSSADSKDSNAYINLWKYNETTFSGDMSLMQAGL